MQLYPPAFRILGRVPSESVGDASDDGGGQPLNEKYVMYVRMYLGTYVANKEQRTRSGGRGQIRWDLGVWVERQQSSAGA
jgi:hypothetical protein